MKDRLIEIRSFFSLSQTDFGKRIGVSGSAISRWESGERDIPESAIILICREFCCSEEWLRTGSGEMLPQRSREEEMGRLVADLMSDSPESFRFALISTLLRFDPSGPEWAVLERIYRDVSALTSPPPPPQDKEDQGP